MRVVTLHSRKVGDRVVTNTPTLHVRGEVLGVGAGEPGDDRVPSVDAAISVDQIDTFGPLYENELTTPKDTTP